MNIIIEALKKLFDKSNGAPMYWLVKDKQWMSERKQLWAELKACLIEQKVFKKSELKKVEAYFLRGERKKDDEMLDTVSLLLSLAWHPSTDADVWLNEFERIKSLAYDDFRMQMSIKNSYIRIRTLDINYKLKSATVKVPNVFLNREALLYEFFFKNKGFSNNALVKSMNVISNEKARALRSLKNLATTYPDYKRLGGGKSYFNCMHSYLIPELAGFLTTEYFHKTAHNEDRKNILQIVFDKCASVVKELDKYEPEFQQQVRIWITQFENKDIAIEWQQLWENAKKGIYQAREEVEVISPIQESNQQNESSDLVMAMRELGYQCQDTDDSLELLLNVFEEKSSGLFDIEGSEATEPPYEAMLEPLQLLVSLRGKGDKITYSDEGMLIISLNGQVFGKINLEDVLENSTSEYFEAVYALAKNWFPKQTFLSTEDGMIVLFILPEEVMKVLVKQGVHSATGFICNR